MHQRHLNNRFESHFIENREVRIFLSSTFSDMDAERSALVKRFDKLKLEANRRNVSLSLLDLRWGVTDEEARTGKVLSVCLNEIENSHPFFIGLLGSRYGYSPDAMEIERNPELKERYPWLSQDIEQGLSITEMEMQYGALRNEKGVEAAFFIKHNPNMQPDDNKKLTKLKRKIREQHRFPVADYCSIDDLCLQVEKVVEGLLDKYFKEVDETRHGWRQNIQRVFMNSRHKLYIPRKEDFDRLNQFLNSKEQDLLVTGQSGIGKSALIANWLKRLECKKHKLPCNIIYHFLGNTFGSNSYEEVLLHICDELVSQNYCRETLLEDYESPEHRAQRYMSEAVKKGKPILVVIDGINQISNSNQSFPFDWLPQPHPKVKYLFSSVEDDEITKAFHYRKYPIYVLKPFNDDQKYVFISEYLSLVGKRLNESQYNRIIHSPITNNALVLRSLLDELICFGSYEYLDERINYYILTDSVAVFFDRILQRMEKDYEGARQLLAVIYVSEHGLSENELVGITGIKNIDFHLFYCAYTTHITNCQGLYNFSHQYIKDAVKARYLKDKLSIEIYRKKIIRFFSNNKSDNSDIKWKRRKLELAFQYYSLSDLKSLYGIILNFHIFNALYSTTEGERQLALYWKKMKESDPAQYQFSDYLELSIDMRPITGLPYLEMASFFCEHFSDYKTSLKYAKKYLTIEKSEKRQDWNRIAKGLVRIGIYYKQLHNYEKALESFFKLLKDYEKIVLYDIHTIYEEMDDDDFFMEEELQNYILDSYINIGEIYYLQDNINKAQEFYLKALKVSKRVFFDKNHPWIASCSYYVGKTHEIMGNYDKAVRNYRKVLSIYKKLYGDFHIETGNCYYRIGKVYALQENYDKAIEYYFKAVDICKLIYGNCNTKIANCFFSIGSAFECQENYNKALEYYNKALALRKETVGNKQIDIAVNYSHIGYIYEKTNDYIKALESHINALKIYKKKYGINHIKTAYYYNDIGRVYECLEDYEKALKYYFMDLEICMKEYGINHLETAACYNVIGDVYKDMKDYDTALEYYFKDLSISENVVGPNDTDIAISYSDIGETYKFKGMPQKALEYYLKAMVTYESVLGTCHPTTADSYNEIADIYASLNDYSHALEYHLKSLFIYHNVYGMDHTITADAYSDVGWDYLQLEEYDKALDSYFKALDFYEKMQGKDYVETANTYFYIGYVYEELENYSKAQEYNMKVLDIYKIVYGDYSANTADAYSNVAWDFLKLALFEDALDYYYKALSLREKVLGKDHPDTQATKENIELIKSKMEIE